MTTDAELPDVIATDGRVIGERAIRTRARLLEATAALVREHGALDVRVMDVAREVGTSPATFYQYFADVEDAIAAIATELVAQAEPLSRLVGADWSGPDGRDLARAFVADYVSFWDRNGPILRVMLLRADERDPRFRGIRRDYNAPFMTNMVAKVRAAQAAGRLTPSLDAEATAGAMLAVLDRLPNFRQGFEKRGTSRDAMIETVALLLRSSLDGEALR